MHENLNLYYDRGDTSGRKSVSNSRYRYLKGVYFVTVYDTTTTTCDRDKLPWLLLNTHLRLGLVTENVTIFGCADFKHGSVFLSLMTFVIVCHSADEQLCCY